MYVFVSEFIIYILVNLNINSYNVFIEETINIWLLLYLYFIILKFVACAKWVLIVLSLSLNNFLDSFKIIILKFGDRNIIKITLIKYLLYELIQKYSNKILTMKH